MELPRLLYKVGSAWVLESGTYDLLTVNDQAELDAALADGWRLDQYAAKAVAEERADDAPPTSAELRKQALDLGLKFDGRTSDRKLAAAIDAVLKP